jgi:hypothetical protein
MPNTSAPSPVRSLPKLTTLLWCLLILMPVLWMYGLLKTYLVNVPFMDDYVWLPFYQKIARHEFTFHDFFFVQMEHRLTIPCVVAWACNLLSPGKIIWHNWISFAQLVVILCGIGWLLVRTGGGGLRRWMPVLAISSWVVFSPAQFSTLLWSDCMSSFMPVAFLVLVLVAFHLRVRLWTKFALCCAFAWLGTNSFASGMNAWLLLVPLILWSDQIQGNAGRKWFLVAWAVAFVITMAFYFHGLTNQAQPEFSYQQEHEETMMKHVGSFFASPLTSLRFVITFSGGLIGKGTFLDVREATFASGLALIGVLVLAIMFMVRSFKDITLRSRLLPWIVFGLYTCATGAMVGLGRLYASKDMEGALWNRYTPHVVPIIVASAVLIVLMGNELAKRREGMRAWVASTRSGFVGAFIVLLICGWSYGIKHMDAWHSSRLRDATCQLFAKVLRRTDIEGPTRTRTMQFAVEMDDLGLLKPPMLKNRLLSNFIVKETPMAIQTARVDVVETSGNGKFEVEGSAFLPFHERVADGVFLTYRDDKGQWIIFSVGQVKEEPTYLNRMITVDMQFLHQRYPDFRRTYGFFDIRFDIEEIPAGKRDIALWAFDFKKQTARRIAGDYKVDTAAGTIVQVGVNPNAAEDAKDAPQ